MHDKKQGDGDKRYLNVDHDFLSVFIVATVRIQHTGDGCVAEESSGDSEYEQYIELEDLVKYEVARGDHFESELEEVPEWRGDWEKVFVGEWVFGEIEQKEVQVDRKNPDYVEKGEQNDEKMVGVVALAVGVVGIWGMAVEGEKGGQEDGGGEYCDHNDRGVMGDGQNGLFPELNFVESLLSVTVVAIRKKGGMGEDEEEGEGEKEVHEGWVFEEVFGVEEVE